ncbi:phytanoyl-CoA hydroxylase [Trichoderma barbatum]
MPSAVPDLYVNDGLLDPRQVELLQETCPHSTPMAELRQRFAKNGYLLLKGLLPREDVLQVRRRYFEMLDETGILKPGTTRVEGIFDSNKDPADFPGLGTGIKGTGTAVSKKFMDLALKAHSEDWYRDQLCKHPVLMDFISKFTDWGQNTWGLERTLLRNNLPGNKAIGVHYDYIFLRHGDDSVLTAWVPIGDVQIDGGGLIYLEKGHDLGKAIEQQFTEMAKASGLTDEEAKFAFNKNMMSGGVLAQGPKGFSDAYQRKWLVSNYEAGDVVLHSSYMIHASTINRDKTGTIRLGTDLRFVDSREPWDNRWAKVYEDDDGL